MTVFQVQHPNRACSITTVSQSSGIQRRLSGIQCSNPKFWGCRRQYHPSGSDDPAWLHNSPGRMRCEAHRSVRVLSRVALQLTLTRHGLVLSYYRCVLGGRRGGVAEHVRVRALKTLSLCRCGCERGV
jgi:hypothetical protein